ncbi:MAG: LacI family DNA-binding transcriptional regulator [Christensenellaceae bacterium]|jgi:DNA-binding LacI/PurR family transcriptional regulator
MNVVKKQFLSMRDIAKLAGVSIATVSRVLNTPELTSKKMHEKVMKVVNEYDYVPSQSAKDVFSGTSKSIALVVDDMANPFFTSYIKNLNKIAFRNHYTLLICDSTVDDGEATESDFFNYCKSIRASGIILTAGTYRQSFGSMENFKSMPVVMLDRESFEDKECFVVRSDHKKGMAMLVDYLYKLNHRKIGFVVGDQNLLPVRERFEAFLENAKTLGLEVPERYLKYDSDYSVDSGVEAFDFFYAMKDSPTAIIMPNDQNAKGFIMRASSLGIKIPDEFSVCGFDGVDTETFYPRITSIRQDTAALAQTTFDFILRAAEMAPPEKKVLDVTMTIGSTCMKV